jgi:choline kinase
MQYIKHAIISAAGFGSRLGMNSPKCIVDVHGKPIIYYLLELLQDIQDVRVVVGYMEEKVIDCVRQIRPDVTFVRNPLYHSTSNSYSLHLATKDLSEPYVIIDGDLLVHKEQFKDFISLCANDGVSRICVTESKSEEAVFTDLDSSGNLIGFSRVVNTGTEWSGIAYLNNVKILANQNYVFEELKSILPVKAYEMEVYEVDTPEDYKLALKGFHKLGYT